MSILCKSALAKTLLLTLVFLDGISPILLGFVGVELARGQYL